jgi:hypothetical protein
MPRAGLLLANPFGLRAANERLDALPHFMVTVMTGMSSHGARSK